jgi:uncharacterized protein involved in type VI secretion and phage assembly
MPPEIVPTPPAAPKRYYGKYRGVVIGNIDPMQIGRVMLQVPDVLGATPSSWAMPCVPVAGLHAGFFTIPPVGSHVWVEFEQGNADAPIWTGGFWGTAAEVPPLAIAPQPKPPGQNILLQTVGQNTLLLSDASQTPATGGILLKSPGGASILVNDTGIFMSNGKGATVTLIGPTVDINAGALSIT